MPSSDPTPERPAADESDEECDWVSPGSSTGRQGSDLMAAKIKRRSSNSNSPANTSVTSPRVVLPIHLSDGYLSPREVAAHPTDKQLQDPLYGLWSTCVPRIPFEIFETTLFDEGYTSVNDLQSMVDGSAGAEFKLLFVELLSLKAPEMRKMKATLFPAEDQCYSPQSPQSPIEEGTDV